MAAQLLVRLRLRFRRWAEMHERGSATLETVVIMPALFALMFMGVQTGLLFHGRAVLLAAAQTGARAAAAEYGSAGAGEQAARTYLANTGRGLSGVSVNAHRSANDAQVTVRATSVSVIPGWKPMLEQSASLPVERITG